MPNKKDVDYVLFLGDLHGGGNGFSPTLKGNARTERQEWLSEQFREMVARVKKESRGKKLALNLGGDLVHAPGADKDRELVAQLLMPLVNVASEVRGVYGTEYHVGDNDAGSDDRAIYRELGANHQDYFYTNFGGLVLDWAHHGISVSKRPRNELNGMYNIVNDFYDAAKYEGETPPNAIIRHHAHRCPKHSPIWHKDIWAGVCPAFCLPDSYAGKVAAGTRPTIGVLWWELATNRFSAWLHPVPREYWFDKKHG